MSPGILAWWAACERQEPARPPSEPPDPPPAPVYTTPARLDLVTDAVARTKDATVEYTAGRRLYGLVEGKLMFSFDRATTQHTLRPYLWATLERR